MPHSHLIKPMLSELYPEIDYGKGVFLYDKAGFEYLDACSGAVTANIGHGIEEILQAIYRQGQQVSFVYRSQFTNEPSEQLAALLSKETGLDWCFLVNSGSEAVETAVKIAIQHWQEKGRPSKRRVISRWLSYHGITLGALSASGHPVRRERFDSFVGDWPAVEPPYCYRCPFGKTYPGCNVQCARQLETVIRRIGEGNVAAFIAEPVIGAAGGAIDAPPEYFRIIKEICEKYEILFIADEVMTGCGRTGTFLAMEHWGIKPDIVALGKGLSAGYAPIAAALVTKEVLQPILQGSQVIMSGHTFSANPLSSAAALAVLKLIKSEKMIEGIGEKAEYLQNELKEMKKNYSFIGDVRGIGLMIGIEFAGSVNGKKIDAAFTTILVEGAKKEGLLLYPAAAGIDGRSGSAVMIAPPFTITIPEIDELIARLERTFKSITEI
ncbi:aspartate aminotransferase family protein [Rossellomorea vietnamensis]|uniref:Aspartate aminotransferase family protein n=1 Tax=Rossellomorea vietnamensis TaxID=218284 RepID=A0A5D4KH30_9BACI|nr:aspartate aminotransferase family protein [Rossellomorea vietnamensis]TYR76567.1 aspartate aminotransferase family protein [Rossellomorea vietnamensis]